MSKKSKKKAKKEEEPKLVEVAPEEAEIMEEVEEIQEEPYTPKDAREEVKQTFPSAVSHMFSVMFGDEDIDLIDPQRIQATTMAAAAIIQSYNAQILCAQLALLRKSMSENGGATIEDGD